MGCSEATGALAAIAVLSSITTVILAVLVALILLWPSKGGVRRKRRAETDRRPDITYEAYTSPSMIQLSKKEKPETNPQDSSNVDLGDEPKKKEALEGPPRRASDIDTPSRTNSPTCMTPESGPLAFARKKGARMSIASISSNISKQFGLRRKSVDELEGVELITSFNLEKEEEATDGAGLELRSTEEARQQQEGAETVSETEQEITAL